MSFWADEVVEERRDHPPDGLRQHDVAERLGPREPERPGGRVLRGCTDSMPARYTSETYAVDERERDDRPEELRVGDPVEAERRHPEAEHEDDEDRRNAAEEVGARDRERADREEHRAREAPQDREEQAAEDDRLRMQNSFTFTQNASRISGNDSR